MTGWASPARFSNLSVCFPAGPTGTETPVWAEPLWYQTHTQHSVRRLHTQCLITRYHGYGIIEQCQTESKADWQRWKKGWFKKNRVNPLCKPSRNRIYSKIRRRDRRIYFSTKWQKTRPAFCWNTRIMVKSSCSTSICTLYTNAVLSKGRLAVEENVFIYFCPFRHLKFTKIRQWHKIWDSW